MFTTIMRLLTSCDLLTTVLSLSILITLIVLIIIYSKVKNNDKILKLWKILCLIPLAISIIHFVIFTAGTAFLHILPHYLPIYIPSVLIALLPLLIKKKVLYKISSTLIIVVCLAFVVLSLSPNKIANYTRKSLSNSYKEPKILYDSHTFLSQDDFASLLKFHLMQIKSVYIQ